MGLGSTAIACRRGNERDSKGFRQAAVFLLSVGSGKLVRGRAAVGSGPAVVRWLSQQRRPFGATSKPRNANKHRCTDLIRSAAQRKSISERSDGRSPQREQRAKSVGWSVVRSSEKTTACPGNDGRTVSVQGSGSLSRSLLVVKCRVKEREDGTVLQ